MLSGSVAAISQYVTMLFFHLDAKLVIKTNGGYPSICDINSYARVMYTTTECSHDGCVMFIVFAFTRPQHVLAYIS